MNIKNIKIEDFNYNLPTGRIAKYPLEQRDKSQLLHWHGGNISSRHFYDLPNILESGDLLVYNNTKVIKARLHFRKTTGATIEIFCLEPYDPADYAQMFQSNNHCTWRCLIGNLKKWKDEPLIQELTIRNRTIHLSATRQSADKGMSYQVKFEWDSRDVNFSDILLHFGELPIPPYLDRDTEESDLRTYQTVYSKIDGSVAAPTAGLHFTKEVLDKLSNKGIKEEEITLHVGAGTFQPVKSETIGEHPMHREIISVDRDSITSIINSLGHIVAVGTTSVRTLESLYFIGCHIAENHVNPDLTVNQWEPYEGHFSLSAREALEAIVNYLGERGLTAINASTQIMIVPTFTFRIVNKIITNFHQPQSTLLLLISAFVGLDKWHHIYDYALQHEYRFLSYGDSSLLEK